MPPIAMLDPNRPIVNTNHAATTGQRWRALHVATRTVNGVPGEPVGVEGVMAECSWCS